MSDKTQASKAIAPSLLAAGNKALGIVPQSFDDCYRMAQLLAQSDIVPKDYKGKPADCCVAILQGLEIGLSPLAALNSIAVINGRASIWGDGALAVVRASGLMEAFSETDENDTATCTIKRRGEPTPIVRTFSQQDAAKAGLATKAGPWTQYPRRMRQMRARSWALRDGFADVLKGLYIAEEAQDIAPRDITPRQPALDIPDDIEEQAPAVSEAEDTQDALIADEPAYLERLAEQLQTADSRELFDECWEAHSALVEAGRISRDGQLKAESLHEETAKRWA